MFEISWSELLILGIVTLIFVGPKELPVFLRTLGRYAGMARKHASEFRAHFDAAMREAELDAMRKEVEDLQKSVNSEVMNASREFDVAAMPPQSNSIAPPPAAKPLPMPPMPAPPGRGW
jgi:sec-independent protein translocase protein TatB